MGRTKQTARKVTGQFFNDAAAAYQEDLDAGWSLVECKIFNALEYGRNGVVEAELIAGVVNTKRTINEAWRRFLCGRYGVGKNGICPLGDYDLMLKLLEMGRYPEHDPENEYVVRQLRFGRDKPQYPAADFCVAHGHHHFFILDGLAAVANDRDVDEWSEVGNTRDACERELIDAVGAMLGDDDDDDDDDDSLYVPPIAAGRTYEDVDGGAFKKWSADHETDTDETKALKARVRAKLGIADAPAAGASAEAEADDAGDGDAERRVRARTE